MDPERRSEELTVLLSRISRGSAEAESELFEALRGELLGLARANLRRQDPGHTLQTTALVHEAWMRLTGGNGVRYENREHFLAVAARAMRFILVDHARKGAREKRGGNRERLPIEIAFQRYEERAVDVLELNDALESLAEQDERQARVVELRFFGGLTVADTAAVLKVSETTVERDWRMARLFLLAQFRAN